MPPVKKMITKINNTVLQNKLARTSGATGRESSSKNVQAHTKK
jgi:hypothetical protein